MKRFSNFIEIGQDLSGIEGGGTVVKSEVTLKLQATLSV
jgi:hypothetical protein